MHEFAIAQGLLKIVECEALPYKGAKVLKIKLRLGKMSGVMPDASKFAFEVISQGGVATGAYLEIEEIPLKIRCHHCGGIFAADAPFMICSHCKSTDVEMISGRELEIESMEIEDGNQSS